MNTTTKLCSIFGLTILALAAAAVIGYRAVIGAAPRTPDRPLLLTSAEQTDLVKRGGYLLSALGCTDCHTPHDQKGEPIAGMFLAGHPKDAPLPQWDPSLLERGAVATIAPTLTAFAGPFGVSVAPNLTPDAHTGIGGTTAEALIKSWRSGTHWRESRPILPPMPAPAFATLTDDDIRALHACLMSLPPVSNQAPASRPTTALGAAR